MKKLFLSLLSACALTVTGTAMALPSQVPYNAFITNGPADIPVGVWFFDLDGDVAGRVCRFYVEWDNNGILPLSSDCFVDQAKVHGAASCIGSSLVPVSTVLTRDPHFPCGGFDRFQQFHPDVCLLILGQDDELGTMDGVIQFSPAISMVNGFELAPATIPLP